MFAVNVVHTVYAVYTVYAMNVTTSIQERLWYHNAKYDYNTMFVVNVTESI